MDLSITCLAVGPLQANAYLLRDPRSGAAVVVDPGGEAERIVAALADAGVAPAAIWLTHAHFDHVGGVAELLETHDVPVYLHPLDAPLYAQAAQQAVAFGVRIRPPTASPVPLRDGERLWLGDVGFDVLHTPGHAPGHVAFYAPAVGALLSGDALFRGGIGRTDLPWCDPAALETSLRDRLMPLPDETRVWPGHGPATTIGYERRTNPFLG